MRGGRRSWMLICAAVSASAGCTFLLGLEDVELADGSTSAGGAGGSGGTTTSSNGGGGQGGAGGGGAGCTAPEINCGTCVNPTDDEAHCGGCDRACDTTCTAGRCRPTELLSMQAAPTSIALDATHAYWINSTTGEVWRKHTIQADAPERMFTRPGLFELVVCDMSTLCGVAPSEVVYSPIAVDGMPTQFDTAASVIAAIATNGDELFWNDDNQEIRRADVGAWSPSLFIGSEIASDIAVTMSTAFWIAGGQVRQSSIASPSAQPLPNFPAASTAVNLAADGSTVCWTDQLGSRIYCVPNVGDNPNESMTTASPVAITINSGHVYWTQTNGHVFRRPVTGGDPELLAIDQVNPTSIAVNDSYVLWTDQDAGTVMRLPRP